MKPLNTGRLNKRITFQRNVKSTDIMNQNSLEWKDFKSVWATASPVRGSEYYEAQKIREELAYKFTTRFFSWVQPDMRIVMDGRTFEINSVINVEEANVMLEIMTTEYVYHEDSAEEGDLFGY